MYPWPSFGSFLFKREEHIIYGTDSGWNLTPSYNRVRPLGSNRDVITTLAIGSAERSWEMYLSVARYNAFLAMINTENELTDWFNVNRQAFLSEVSQVEEVGSYFRSSIVERKIRTRVTFVSA